MKNPAVGDRVTVKKSTQFADTVMGKVGAITVVEDDGMVVWTKFPDEPLAMWFKAKELKRDELRVGDRVKIGPLPHGIGGTTHRVGQEGVVILIEKTSSGPVARVNPDGEYYWLYFDLKDLERVR